MDVANMGNAPTAMQDTSNTTIAVTSEAVIGGLVPIHNDTTNINAGTYTSSQKGCVCFNALYALKAHCSIQTASAAVARVTVANLR